VSVLDIGFDPDEEERLHDEHGVDPRSGTAYRRYLTFVTDLELRTRVAAMPAPRWLACPVLPADAYWIFGAEDKAGKSFAMLDLAVSVAYGGAWLGAFPCEVTGRVVLFLGEGGERKTLRRLDAIFEHKHVVGQGRIGISFRVPHLSSTDHLDEIRRELDREPAALLIVDPLYLAARGARGSDLYSMGEALEGVQHVAQDYGAGLGVATHYKKGEAGNSFAKITGVGPGAWGRVLITGDVVQRHTDPDDRSTRVTLDLNFRGDEIPDTTTRVVRRISTDDPDDLTSAMHYEVDTIDVSERDQAADDRDGLTPSQRRVLIALRDKRIPLTVLAVGDLLAADGQGKPLKARTIQTAIQALTSKGLVDSTVDPDDKHGRRSTTWAT
jgi:hypothetical protein